MSTTSNLSLPYIAAGQAQKHVTMNESLRALDAVVQLSVVTRALAAPPASPAAGARYIVATSPSGAWISHTGKIAAFQDGGWIFYPPKEGWVAWVQDEDKLYAYDGANWIVAGGGTQNLAMVGVNATADATNRLSVTAPATLLNHEGAGHQLKINKVNAANTASLLYQTGFSGRAEMGLAGDDKFRIKVSADGSTWKDAITIDPAGAGRVGVGTMAPTAMLHVNGEVRVGSYTVAGVPAASASGAGAIIFVSNEAGGAVLAFSDGTTWRRVTDRAVIS